MFYVTALLVNEDVNLISSLEWQSMCPCNFVNVKIIVIILIKNFGKNYV